MKHAISLSFCILATCSVSAFAQSSGQSATVNIGVVEQTESVGLQSTGGSTGGAVVGATIGHNLGSGNSQSKKRRRAIIGGSIGSAAASSGTTPGMQYTVKLDNGSTVVVVSDQIQLRVGDCVSVEEARSMTNIRQQDPAACNPEVKEAIADLQDELIEDADECAQVKQELLAAKTIDEVELATAKSRILCN